MSKRKRFTIGVILLMGGWGLTWYAHEQQQGVGVDSALRLRLWMGQSVGSAHLFPSRYIYAAGILIMTVGAGVTAFNLPLPEGWK